MCMSTSTRAQLLMADCYAEICIPVVALGLWWKGRSGANTTSVWHGTGTAAQLVSLSYNCFLSFSFSFSSFASPSLAASCRTEGLTSYEMVLAAYIASFSFSLFHSEFPLQSSAGETSTETTYRMLGNCVHLSPEHPSYSARECHTRKHDIRKAPSCRSCGYPVDRAVVPGTVLYGKATNSLAHSFTAPPPPIHLPASEKSQWPNKSKQTKPGRTSKCAYIHTQNALECH
ncbi:hypothetical protein B9Z19DRAFT_35463 [Tuber borchii]|uniref:Uncharacterized protein n=1 Tax=Tuber borchii TaxID=42251 RepID=A0A2T6ZTP3_TUBBO|nr:hypothetical protein B9Z19DRAFT_35463 [Tuber borchii]